MNESPWRQLIFDVIGLRLLKGEGLNNFFSDYS